MKRFKLVVYVGLWLMLISPNFSLDYAKTFNPNFSIYPYELLTGQKMMTNTILSAENLLNLSNEKGSLKTTIESTSQKDGVLTVSIRSIGISKNNNQKLIDTRLVFSLRSDAEASVNYMTYLKFKNLLTGETKEKRVESSFDEQEGLGEILGMFYGLSKFIYDKDKLLAKSSHKQEASKENKETGVSNSSTLSSEERKESGFAVVRDSFEDNYGDNKVSPFEAYRKLLEKIMVLSGSTANYHLDNFQKYLDYILTYANYRTMKAYFLESKAAYQKAYNFLLENASRSDIDKFHERHKKEDMGYLDSSDFYNGYNYDSYEKANIPRLSEDEREQIKKTLTKLQTWDDFFINNKPEAMQEVLKKLHIRKCLLHVVDYELPPKLIPEYKIKVEKFLQEWGI